MKKVFEYFVYGSWWVAICAAGLGLLTWYELTRTCWNSELFFFILGSTLVIYNLNMLTGLNDLRTLGTRSERHHWCMENERSMRITLIIGLIMAALSVWWLNYSVLFFVAPLTVVALAYTVPMVKKQTERIRVREIGLWKIFLIAAVWAGMTAILPAVQCYGWEQVMEMRSWQMALERAVFIFAITIPFDIRDLENDAKKGIRTLPSVLGWKRSLIVAQVALGVFMGLLSIRLDPHSPVFIGYAVGTILTSMVLSVASPDRGDMYCSFWVEGTMLVQTISVLLAIVALS